MSGARRIRGRWLIIAAPVVVLASAGLIAMTFAFQSNGPISRDLSKAKRVAAPLGGPGPKLDPSMIAAHGVVEPAQPEVRLTADAPGRIAGLFAAEGDHVEKGS